MHAECGIVLPKMALHTNDISGEVTSMIHVHVKMHINF